MLALAHHSHRGPCTAHQRVEFTTQVTIGNVIAPHAVGGVPLGVGCHDYWLDTLQR
jgi:hypothetical protein